jgi:hypothetical protein
MCTHFIAPYSPSYPLSPTSPLSQRSQPSPLDRTCSALLLSDFIGEKNGKDKTKTMTVELEIKVAIKGVSL